MNIYFTSAMTADGQYSAQKKRIITAIKRLGHTLTSGEQIVIPSLQKKEKSLSPQEIFIRQKEKISHSDCVIAEATKPSSGMGGEIVYALVQNKPVLALFYKEAQQSVSPMIEGNPSDHLYKEHYDDDNLHVILRRFISHVETSARRKGRLIVIDGGDGSGKTIQSNLLVTYLQTKGIPVKYMDFPRYYTSFHGKIVARFLNGEFGTLNEVSPYLISLAYALDRASAKEEMDEWLTSGGYIVSNRYTTSSMAHQAAKLPQKDRNAFIQWIDELEYKVHKVPREDIVIYLYVPWKTGVELTSKKGKRGYLSETHDIAEKDYTHRIESEQMYLSLAASKKNWERIDCVRHDRLLSKQEIHGQILTILKKHRMIP